jgi:N-methylhydantoinase A
MYGFVRYPGNWILDNYRGGLMAEQSAIRVAVDIGGTFTDFVVFDPATGESTVGKVPSTPANPSEGIVQGLKRMGVDLSRVEFFVHGTTVGLNAVVEEKGRPVALVTTKGFRDVLEIGLMDKPDMYNIFYEKPRPLVPRRHRFELDERVDGFGNVLRAVNETEVAALAEAIRDEGLRTIAVCTLNSFANPANEARIAELLRAALPDAFVSVSHEIVNEWREFERTSTTTLNAYVVPVFSAYLESLRSELAELGLETEAHIMQSNGGVMTAAAASRRPIRTLLSGPVGGAVGGGVIGRLADADPAFSAVNIVTADMGGTSFDASLIIGGEIETSNRSEIAGRPLLTPSVRVSAIGAGGGSIARVEGSSSLRVGPDSAGAVPGPVGYGRGGEEPTVTDANLVLGRIDPEQVLGGEITLDKDAARNAIDERIAKPLGLDVHHAAEGILRVINSKMALAIRELTVAQGLDPRDFTLVAFGGAGPMHAAEIAVEAGISQVIFPPVPGMFSAWGMLAADIRHDLVMTAVAKAGDLDAADVETTFAALEAEGGEVLAGQNVADGAIRFIRSLDLRYLGQEHTLEVEVPTGLVPADLKELFDKAHSRKYGHLSEEDPVEVVNFRVAAVGHVAKPDLKAAPETASAQAVPLGEREVYFDGAFVTSAVYTRNDIPPRATFSGPAVIDEEGATLVVPPGFDVVCDPYGNLVLSGETRFELAKEEHNGVHAG